MTFATPEPAFGGLGNGRGVQRSRSGADGLAAYRAIADDARRLLAPGGLLVLELGAGQRDAVTSLTAAAGLTPGACRNDLSGVPRALAVTVSA